MNSLPVLAVVVPCFNAEAVLPEAMRRLDALLGALIDAGDAHPETKAWYVDDGSRDRTWALIEQESVRPGSRAAGIKLSRNRGHQIELLAGLMNAKADVLMRVDADLQDDLAVIPKMLEAHAVFNHADYRLMSRRSVEALREFEESNIFLRGIIPLLGYPTSSIEYERAERFAGESKYPLGKMLALPWQGVTSFSAVPLRAITTLGVMVSLLSLSIGVWALWIRLFTNDAVPGWASVVIPQFLLSGVQLLSLGVIGEYLAKIFIETKRRPPYFVESLMTSACAVPSANPVHPVGRVLDAGSLV